MCSITRCWGRRRFLRSMRIRARSPCSNSRSRASSNSIIARQLGMSLLGVPYPQRKLVEAQHAGGVSRFIREAVEYVFRQLPLADNYFYRVYITGQYRKDCCPEYLKEAGFNALKVSL